MDTPEFLIYWQVIRKRLWLIGLLVATTLGMIALLSYLSGPSYRASTSFQVTAPLPAGVYLFEEFRTSSTSDELARTSENFVAFLQSEFVMGEVISELGLNADVDELRRHIVVQPDENSTFIHLRVTAPDPALAANIANALVDTALRYFGELNAGGVTANKEFIQQQIEETKGQLEEARAALSEFQVINKTGDPGGLIDSYESLILQLELDRDKALVAGQETVAGRYDQAIAERERELQDLIWLNAEYDDLAEEVGRIKEIYSTLLAKKSEAELKENEIMSARFIQVLPAPEPSRPLPLVNVKILLLGAIVSLALGVLLAFLLQYLEPPEVTPAAARRIHRPESSTASSLANRGTLSRASREPD
jgi:uncharacterized protein involved in exopolysaccharide biosynthesis